MCFPLLVSLFPNSWRSLMAFTTSPRNRNHGILSVGLILMGLILSLSSPAHLLAQEVGATLFGTITDTAGATVPEATVTVTNPDTGKTFSTTTQPDGHYVATALTPGTYTITVEHT